MPGVVRPTCSTAAPRPHTHTHTPTPTRMHAHEHTPHDGIRISEGTSLCSCEAASNCVCTLNVYHMPSVTPTCSTPQHRTEGGCCAPLHKYTHTDGGISEEFASSCSREATSEQDLLWPSTATQQYDNIYPNCCAPINQQPLHMYLISSLVLHHIPGGCPSNMQHTTAQDSRRLRASPHTYTHIHTQTVASVKNLCHRAAVRLLQKKITILSITRHRSLPICSTAQHCSPPPPTHTPTRSHARTQTQTAWWHQTKSYIIVQL